MKYAAFEYIQGVNLGDTIQTIAAQQYLPRTDFYLDRDTLRTNSSICDDTFYISNGCCDTPNAFPLNQPLLHPFFISVHLHHPLMLTPDINDYLRQHGPIGCRDQHTYDLLKRLNIPSYYSSCLTLTLPRPDSVCRRDNLLIVDVNRTLLPMIPAEMRRKAIYLTHTIAKDLPLLDRIDYAQKSLRLYAEAKLVITGRLHCALPCIAMNTPVVLLHENPEDSRLETARRFIPVYSFGDTINWNPIPPDIVVTRQALQKICYQAVTKQHIRNSVSRLAIPKGYSKTKNLRYKIYKNIRKLYLNIPQDIRDRVNSHLTG